MRYMLLIYSDESLYPKMSEADTNQLMQEYGEFTEAVQKAGVLKESDRLHPTTAATTVRVRNRDTLTTDGPFAETKEQLGGFYMIEAKDLDEAIGWAAKIPSAADGSIEVRPIMEFGDHEH